MRLRNIWFLGLLLLVGKAEAQTAAQIRQMILLTTTTPTLTTPVVTAEATGTSTADVSWTTPTGATNFLAESSLNGTTGWSTIYSGSGTSVSLTSLSPGTTYYIRVTASGTGYTNSAYGTANFTTTSGGGGGATTPFYVVWGQSNVGYVGMAARQGSPDRGDSAYLSNPMKADIWNVRYSNPTWDVMYPGVNTAINDVTYPDGISVAVTFIKRILEVNPSSDSIYVFQEGHGGQPLAAGGSWGSTGVYGNATTGTFYTNLATNIAQAAARGKQLEFKGILQVQGETDAESSTRSAAYRAALDTFYRTFFNKLTAIMNSNSMTTPVVKRILMAQIAYPGATYRTAVRTAQSDFCAVDTNRATLIPTDSIPLLSDNLHYTSPGILTLGKKFYYALNPTINPGSYDAATTAYGSATGIIDTFTLKNVNRLVLDLKAASIWTDRTAIYLLNHQSATKNAVNLKNPGTYNLTFNGTIYHTSGGTVSNGTTGYATTGYAPGTNIASNFFISYWDKTNIFETNYPGGASDNVVNAAYMQPSYASTCQTYNNAGTGGILGAAGVTFCAGDRRGMISYSRTSSTHQEVALRGFKIGEENTTMTGTNLTYPIFIHAINSAGAAAGFSGRTIPIFEFGVNGTTAKSKLAQDAYERYLINMGLL